jgi:membrane peptidoglycan carboxypeptidase
MRRLLRGAAWAVGAALIALIAYEAFALGRARQVTPDVVAMAGRGELRLEQLTPRRQAMLLKVEDPGFFDHHGVDFSTPGQGRTNLTQSLVKRFYFAHFKPGFAKIEQMLIARFVFDPALSKQGQLKAYLNYAYFGHLQGQEVIGFAKASRTFYGREFEALDDRQFLSLVAMLMAPNDLDPIRHPRENAERVRRIEALLAGRCKPTGVGDVRYSACA